MKKTGSMVSSNVLGECVVWGGEDKRKDKGRTRKTNIKRSRALILVVVSTGNFLTSDPYPHYVGKVLGKLYFSLVSEPLLQILKSAVFAEEGGTSPQ